jgi:hypothetical protein
MLSPQFYKCALPRAFKDAVNISQQVDESIGPHNGVEGYHTSDSLIIAAADPARFGTGAYHAAMASSIVMPAKLKNQIDRILIRVYPRLFCG